MDSAETLNRELKEKGQADEARRAREQLLTFRDSQKAGRVGNDAREKLAQRDQQSAINQIVAAVMAKFGFTVNSPHKASVSEGNVALTIVTQPPQGDAQSASAANFPFRILDASASGTNKVKGYSNSYVFKTTDMTTPLTLAGTGLNTAATVVSGDACFVEVALDNTVAVTAQYFRIGATWTDYPAAFHVDNSTPASPFIDKVFILIAEIVALADSRDGTLITGDSTLKAVQRWRNNILLLRRAEDVNGYATYFPRAYS